MNADSFRLFISFVILTVLCAIPVRETAKASKTLGVVAVLMLLFFSIACIIAVSSLFKFPIF